MPGIVGIVSRRPAADCQQLVTAMVASMRHESFYEFGTCSAPELGVHAGWTAHPHSFAQRESSTGSCDDVATLVAGECYGDGGSPSLASAYREFGDGFVSRLNGLFSGLLIDRSRRRVVLFNDRFGLERIYIHETPETLYFASEAKALLRVVPELRSFDDRGVAQLLAFGCTFGGRTLFRDVTLLDAGSLWSLEGGAWSRTRYLVPECLEKQSILSADAFNDTFAATFKSVLPRYVSNGDRLGISLTAGLDTRMIMACLPATPARPVAYTFSGLSERTLDERIAARVAGIGGLDHRVLRIGTDFLTDFGRFVDKTVYVADGSFGATGAHEVYLNAKVRTLAPVRLTGNFGSEVLRSMSTFKPLGLAREMLHPDVAVSVAALSLNHARASEHPVTFSAFREIPSSLFGTLAAGRSQVTLRTPYLDNDIVSLAYRAPAQARQSPDSALHLIATTHPTLASIPTDRGVIVGGGGLAHFARRALAEVTFKLDYVHHEGLPNWLSPIDPVIHALSKLGVLGLHKYLPYRRWFRQELRPYITQVLTDGRTLRMPYWNRAFLEMMVKDHGAGRRNYLREISTAMTLEAVDRLLLKEF